MRITDALLGEHGPLNAQMKRVDDHVAQLDSLAAIAAVAEVLIAGLVSHAELEDELLFASLAKSGADGPWAEMMQEHEQIAAALRDAQTAPSVEAARSSIHDAIRAAQEHFQKEEELLFSLAEEQLPQGQTDALVNRWAKARGVVFA